MAIDPRTAAALKIMVQVLTEEGRKFVLIGATVPQLLIDLRQGWESVGRTTRDADAVVEVVSWDDFAHLCRRLFQAGFQPGSAPHELRFSEDVRIDLIPFGPGLVEEDRLVWPDTDRAMSTIGIEEAFECARLEEVAPGLCLPVVSIPGLVLLKLVAYQDRPEERARDLIDVVYCFEHYEELPERSRRFELVGITAEGQPVRFEEAGASLLGIEVAKLAKPRSLIAIGKFLDRIPDEYARPISQILYEEKRIVDDEDRRRELFRLFRVFAAGLSERATST
jgi:predicted nucleotidyltransferase